MSLRNLLLVPIVLFPIFLISQVQVNHTITAQNAVNNILLGSGVTAENITFSGDQNQIGSFSSNGSNMPISAGVVIGQCH